MNKSVIKIGDRLYWNTTGAYNSEISLICTIVDIGQHFIWIMVDGNLSPTPVHDYDLSEKAWYKVTNIKEKK